VILNFSTALKSPKKWFNLTPKHLVCFYTAP
jgi:hypothetical protein